MRSVQVQGVSFILPSESTWKIELRPGGWLVGESADGRRRRWKVQEGNSRVVVSCQGYTWSAAWVSEVESERQVLSDQIVASLPGSIRKVWVKPGQEVVEGDPLVLMEAMKMEFWMQAPCAGRIEAVFVQEGQCVELGEVLLKWCSSDK